MHFVREMDCWVEGNAATVRELHSATTVVAHCIHSISRCNIHGEVKSVLTLLMTETGFRVVFDLYSSCVDDACLA